MGDAVPTFGHSLTPGSQSSFNILQSAFAPTQGAVQCGGFTTPSLIVVRRQRASQMGAVLPLWMASHALRQQYLYVDNEMVLLSSLHRLDQPVGGLPSRG